MRKVEFENTLKKTLHQMPLEETSKQLEQIKLCAKKELYRRNNQKHISFSYFLWKQVKFVGWKLWAAQGSFLLILRCVINSLYGNDFLESPRVLIKLLFCISVLLAMTSLPLIYRTVRYQMHEIEAAAYFSSGKLLMAKLAVIGIGDFFVLLGMFLISISKTPLYAGNAVLYMILPFLVVSNGCLYMLGHFKTRNFMIGSVVFSALLMMFFVIVPGKTNGLFYQSMNMGWLAVFVILSMFCIQQLRYILNHLHYIELQIE